MVRILTDKLLKDGIISAEETEVVEYGLESIGSSLLGLLTILTIGACFDFAWGTLFLWLLIFPLRKNAGGFHAETKARCLLFSATAIIVAIVCLQQIKWTEAEYILIAAMSAVVIWLMAPVGNGNKRLDSVECRVYRQRTRKILLIEMLIFVLSLTFDWEDLMIVITMAFSIVCVVLLTGKVKILMLKK